MSLNAGVTGLPPKGGMLNWVKVLREPPAFEVVPSEADPE